MTIDSASLTSRQRIIAIVSASSGNLVEWFDFYVYSFCSIYFAPAFFPQGDATSQLLKTAGVFAVGFFMRPVGGWLFGRIADRRGRRAAMIISVLMMCGGSLTIAALPGYATIGAWAPWLLLLARLIQGLSVGGEYGTSATYMSEVAEQGRRGFFASFQYVTLIGGQLLAVLVLVVLQQFLDHAQLLAWGWRIPFVVGAFAALIALHLRRTLNETTTEQSRQDSRAGTLAGVMQHKAAFVTVLGFTAAGSLSFYTYTTYMQKFLVNSTHMNPEVASLVMTSALLCYMGMQPLFGALSDRIGRRNNMLLFGVLAGLLTVPLMQALSGTTSPLSAFGLIIVALAIISFYTSIAGVIKAEMFPAEVRALGVGLSYAIANAAFGGSAEYVALWLKQAGNESAFFWYVSAMCGLSLVFTWKMKESSRHGFLEN